ncbi:MAG: helicase-related protein, partial [Candidatus Eremiobacterota bacterium]
LMVLLQKLVTSSTEAIKTTLEKRLNALSPDGNLPEELEESLEEDIDFDEISDVFRVKMDSEIEEVKNLLSLAEKCSNAGYDAKTEALIDRIYCLTSEEEEPDLKFLIFTEFVATQKMLQKYLTERGFSVAILNGSFGLTERADVQKVFAEKVRILISTDAGGEGINLQFCHIVINYDIPWAPAKLEQRIGRVDRIGQSHRVKAINFFFKNTVESRVYEVLQIKLKKISEEFGIDKTSDILDSGEAEKEFRNLYINSIIKPETVEHEVERVASELLQRAKKAKDRWDKLHSKKELKHEEAEKILGHPLPYWVEKMVVNYLISHGKGLEKGLFGYNLFWEDGEIMKNIIFSRENIKNGNSENLSIEHPKVMKLIKNLPLFVPGEKVPKIYIKDLPPGVNGYWSLWKILLQTPSYRKERIMPLFRQEDGRIFKTTAHRLWDIFLSHDSHIECCGEICGDEAELIYMEMEDLAIKYGEDVMNELKENHRDFLRKEREKGEYAFNARRKAVERIGLTEVKNYRLRLLEKEKDLWNEGMAQKEYAIPDISCLIICYTGEKNELK